jgi:hypothetical protein
MEQGDEEIGETAGAWSLWDIPTSLAAQIDDPFGDDIILVAVADRLYQLDWAQYTDEWEPNAHAPIYRLIEFGPIPPEPSRDAGEAGYVENVLHRFREFWAVLKHEALELSSRIRITIGEWERPENRRQATYETTEQLDAQIALKGRAFTVKLEHAADEPFALRSWQAEWDIVGARTRGMRRG